MPINPYERKTSDIYISDKLRDVLEIFKDKSEVAKHLLYRRLSKDILQENHINYIGVSVNDPTKISYLPVDRIEKIEQSNEDDFWTTSKRIACKPGTFIGKLFNNISAKEVENFSTLYKTFSAKKDLEFKVVSGEDIRKYYNYETYFNQRGTLGSSCMKSDICQPYFDIYTENSNISMLVLFSREDLVLGRALLWTNGEDKIMDRIYTISDEEYLNHMTKWAIDNGYSHRLYQNWANSVEFTDGKVEFEKQIDIQLEKWTFKRYPYLDTFKWLDLKTGILTNYRPKHFLDERENEHVTLAAPTGGYEWGYYLRFDDLERRFAYYGDLGKIGEDRWTSTSNCRWSETLQQWILRDEATYSETLEDYIYSDLEKNPKDLVKARMDFVIKIRGKKPATGLLNWYNQFMQVPTTVE